MRHLFLGVSCWICGAAATWAADCNGNGQDDVVDIRAGESRDCNGNLTPDECDLAGGNVSWALAGRHVTGASPVQLIVDDFNADGHDDLAVLTVQPSLLHVTLNDGKGELQPDLQPIELRYRGSGDMVAGDWDRDGDPDLLVTGFWEKRLTLIENDGDGRFTPGTDLPLGPNPGALLCGDFDGDGDQDLLVANYSADSFHVRLFNNEEGGLVSGERSDLPERTGQFAVGDVNGDGIDDLVTSSHLADSDVTLLLGTRDGVFTPPEALFGPVATTALLLIDVDVDEDLDVVLLTRHERARMQVLLGEGDGSFVVGPATETNDTAERTDDLVAADFDGDGDLDLAAGTFYDRCTVLGRKGLLVHFNLGAGEFSPPFLADSTDAVQRLAAGDFDRDGRIDLAFGAAEGAREDRWFGVLSNRLDRRSLDCNGNGIPDDCDLAELDCNQNAVPDDCEIADETARDCNGNGVPDGCEFDCDENGVPDDCDLAAGDALDENGNGLLDACEAARPDCNHNAVADDREIAAGDAADCNENGVPDDCEVLVGGLRFESPRPATIAVGEPARQLVAADFDRDGHLDVLVTRWASCCGAAPPSGALALFGGDGNGGFTQRGESLTVGDPTHARATDIDGDGDADLVVLHLAGGCAPSSTLSTYLNDGEGRFTWPQSTRLSAPAYQLSSFGTDWDDDGDEDALVLATLDEGFVDVLVCLNDGRGGFVETARFAIPVTLPRSVSFADLDRDGDLDVVGYGHSGSIWTLENNAGVFETLHEMAGPLGGPPRRLLVGDLDRDEDNDLLVIYDRRPEFPEMAVLWKEDDGRFVPGESIDLPSFVSFAEIHDFDDDGLLDLAVIGEVSQHFSGFSARSMAVLLGQPGRMFSAPQISLVSEASRDRALADADGDGHVDLVNLTGRDELFVLPGNGDGTFRSGFLHFAAVVPEKIVAGDFNSDGRQDVAGVAPDGNVVAVVMNGGDRFVISFVNVGAPVEALAAGDFEADGVADLALVAESAVWIFRKEKVEFVARQVVPVGSNPAAIVAADLDGDGDADLATANALPGNEVSDNVSVLINQGEKGFLPPRNFSSELGPTAIVASDFDHDGRVDLAVLNERSKTIGWFQNEGRGTFRVAGSLSLGLPAASRHLLAVDLDSDGWDDLLAGDNENVFWFRNQRDATFAKAVSLEIPRVIALDAADLNGDGFVDLVTVSEDFELAARLNRGDAAFRSPVSQALDGEGGGGSGDPVASIASVAAADLDGDGQNDILVAIPEANLATLLLNRTAMGAADVNQNGVPDECEFGGDVPFRRGDANGDGLLNLTDAVRILRFLFVAEVSLTCRKSGDANDDGRINVTDGVAVLRSLFQGTGPLPEPGPALCGTDPSDDSLGCETFEGC